MMSSTIKTISLKNKLAMTVNCYLVNTGSGFVLIDSSFTSKRHALEKKLENADCQPGNLKLIIITHGDFDHIGNCAYLCEKYGTKIAMHKDDSGMGEYGDLFCGDLLENTQKPVLNSIIDDVEEAKVSINKLNSLKIKTVYPGHGMPFQMEQVLKHTEVRKEKRKK